MNLKNYTSTVPPERTAARIEDRLRLFGATSVSKEYSGGKIAALTFRLVVDERPINVRLPIDVQAAKKVMQENRRRYTSNLEDQAERTAWRLMQDWVEIQLALIQLHQAEPLEVFLSYAWDGKTSFYNHLQANHFKALPLPEDGK